jgi:hypothetical protein
MSRGIERLRLSPGTATVYKLRWQRTPKKITKKVDNKTQLKKARQKTKPQKPRQTWLITQNNKQQNIVCHTRTEFAVKLTRDYLDDDDGADHDVPSGTANTTKSSLNFVDRDPPTIFSSFLAEDARPFCSRRFSGMCRLV